MPKFKSLHSFSFELHDSEGSSEGEQRVAGLLKKKPSPWFSPATSPTPSLEMPLGGGNEEIRKQFYASPQT